VARACHHASPPASSPSFLVLIPCGVRGANSPGLRQQSAHMASAYMASAHMASAHMASARMAPARMAPAHMAPSYGTEPRLIGSRERSLKYFPGRIQEARCSSLCRLHPLADPQPHRCNSLELDAQRDTIKDFHTFFFGSAAMGGSAITAAVDGVADTIIAMSRLGAGPASVPLEAAVGAPCQTRGTGDAGAGGMIPSNAVSAGIAGRGMRRMSTISPLGETSVLHVVTAGVLPCGLFWLLLAWYCCIAAMLGPMLIAVARLEPWLLGTPGDSSGFHLKQGSPIARRLAARPLSESLEGTSWSELRFSVMGFAHSTEQPVGMALLEPFGRPTCLLRPS